MQTSKLLNAFFIFTFVIFIAGCGGVVLSGTVRNSSTGLPIEGVTVEVKPTTTNTSLQSITTDKDGYFRIEKLMKKETYQLTFKKETIETQQKEYNPTRIGKKKAESLNIQLDEFSVIKGKVFGMIDNDKIQEVSGAVVELLEEKSDSWAPVPGISEEKTKPDGSFIISGIAKPGKYRLQIYEASYRSTRYPTDTSYYLKKGEVWKIEDRQIVLKPGGVSENSGELKGGAKNKPEPGGRVMDTPTISPGKGDEDIKE
jgi:hypothetical protein